MSSNSLLSLQTIHRNRNFFSYSQTQHFCSRPHFPTSLHLHQQHSLTLASDPTCQTALGYFIITCIPYNTDVTSFSFTSDSTARTEAFCFVKVCRDVNECEGLNNGGCVENSICMNTPVSKSSKLDLKKTSACKCKPPTDIYRDQIKWTQMV